MRTPACGAGGESRKRSAGWAGYTAGSNKRSAEKLSASRNRGSLFLLRMLKRQDSSIGLPVNRSGSSFDSNAVFPQKIKIAAELRAENGIRIEFGIAARRSSDGPYLAPPVFKILFGNHSIDAPFSYA